jgi:hypothetical protein
MAFGSLIIPNDGLIYPSAVDAVALLLSKRGDNAGFVNFNGKIYCYLGDGGYNVVSKLNTYGLSMPQVDPTKGQKYDYIVDGSSHVLAPFLDIPGWKPGSFYHSHLQGSNGIDLGGRMIKFNNLVFAGLAHPVYSTVYYSDDGEVFFNKVGTAALAETDFDDSVLWDWSTETVRFMYPRVCQTLFDSKGRPCKTSKYFERSANIAGVPIYQDYRPVVSTETLYCYIYGQQSDFEQAGGNGTLCARVKVYESGAWLSSTPATDPIFDTTQWEFWTGYFWQTGLENAREITQKFSNLWTSDVQYSGIHNKFFMVTTETSTLFFDNGWDFGTTTSAVNVFESLSPVGPWTNKKTLVTNDYDPNRQFVDDCSIVGIENNKLIVAATFWKADIPNTYITAQAGYGSYFASVQI